MFEVNWTGTLRDVLVDPVRHGSDRTRLRGIALICQSFAYSA